MWPLFLERSYCEKLEFVDWLGLIPNASQLPGLTVTAYLAAVRHSEL